MQTLGCAKDIVQALAVSSRACEGCERSAREICDHVVEHFSEHLSAEELPRALGVRSDKHCCARIRAQAVSMRDTLLAPASM